MATDTRRENLWLAGLCTVLEWICHANSAYLFHTAQGERLAGLYGSNLRLPLFGRRKLQFLGLVHIGQSLVSTIDMVNIQRRPLQPLWAFCWGRLCYILGLGCRGPWHGFVHVRDTHSELCLLFTHPLLSSPQNHLNEV